MIDRQYQLNFWLGWTFANSIGVACGWMLGEYVGRWNPTFSWVAFELPIWLVRWTVLNHVKKYNSWNPVDTIIWISGELVGRLIGEGFKETGTTWMTAGPVFALTSGASVWFVLWTMRQAKTSRRLWVLRALLWGLLGMTIASLLIGVSVAVSLEIGEITGEVLLPVLSWAISGSVLGAFIGSITGLAIAGLLRKPISSSKPSHFSIP